MEVYLLLHYLTRGGASGILNYYFSTNFKVPQAKSFSVVSLEILKFNMNKNFNNYKNILHSKKLLDFKKIKKNIEIILLSQKKKKSYPKLSLDLEKINYDLLNKLDMISSRNNIRLKQSDLKN